MLDDTFVPAVSPMCPDMLDRKGPDRFAFVPVFTLCDFFVGLGFHAPVAD